MIPAWHQNTLNIAYWHFLGRPQISPKYAPTVFDAWFWKDQTKDTTKDQDAKESPHDLSLWGRLTQWIFSFLTRGNKECLFIF